MTAADWWSVGIAVVSVLTIGVLAGRSGHYVRTGRWFR